MRLTPVHEHQGELIARLAVEAERQQVLSLLLLQRGRWLELADLCLGLLVNPARILDPCLQLAPIHGPELNLDAARCQAQGG